jgi:hypothetical protein
LRKLAHVALAVVFCGICVPARARAAVIAIDFEALSEFDAVTTQFPGVTFSNTTVLTAGSSLNEFENPPRSGSNVAFDDGGPILIAFASPVSEFGGYFTYTVMPGTRLTLTAFDSSHAALGPPTLSAHANNQLSSGDPASSPNEFLELLFPNIWFVTIEGKPGGGSFTVDNLTFDAPTIVPEPGALLLVGISLTACFSRYARTVDN